MFVTNERAKKQLWIELYMERTTLFTGVDSGYDLMKRYIQQVCIGNEIRLAQNLHLLIKLKSNAGNIARDLMSLKAER